MTQSIAAARARTPGPVSPGGSTPVLSLRHRVPSDWHQDQPAYAGDPDMDWINLPEPPREPNWGLSQPRKD